MLCSPYVGYSHEKMSGVGLSLSIHPNILTKNLKVRLGSQSETPLDYCLPPAACRSVTIKIIRVSKGLCLMSAQLIWIKTCLRLRSNTFRSRSTIHLTRRSERGS